MSQDTRSGTDQEAGLGPRLGPLALAALVVGSMVGAGIFSLPQNMADAPAAPGALMVGWVITAIGMLALALTFQWLGSHAEDTKGGLHGYARDGFGPLMGFFAAWGYWISAWLGNIAYLVLVVATLGQVFGGMGADEPLWGPGANFIGDGTTWGATILSSVVLWVCTLLLLRGVKEASGVNVVVTIAKLVPLLLFIVLATIHFDPSIFTEDLWGKNDDLGSLTDQIRGMMLVTVWAFLGIEGASIYARRARNRKDVGKATVGGFILVIGLLVAVNMLSAGIMSRADLAELEDPAIGGVLEHAVGKWGAAVVIIGLLISVSGALLAWMLMCAEILSSTGRAGAFPKAWGREPRVGVPATAILITSVVLQGMLILTHFLGARYNDVILMAGSMMLVPYLLSAAYALKLASGRSRPKIIALTGVATAYGVWLIYAGGLDYLLVSALFYGVGLAVHVWARKERGHKALEGVAEWVLFVVVALAAVWAAFGISQGTLDVWS